MRSSSERQTSMNASTASIPCLSMYFRTLVAWFAIVSIILRFQRGNVRVPALVIVQPGLPSTWLLALSEKVLNGLVNVVLVFDARHHKVVDVGNVVLQFADELAAAVRAFDLAITEQVDLRQ